MDKGKPRILKYKRPMTQEERVQVQKSVINAKIADLKDDIYLTTKDIEALAKEAGTKRKHIETQRKEIDKLLKEFNEIK